MFLRDPVRRDAVDVAVDLVEGGSPKSLLAASREAESSSAIFL
jgi:hypothetical protein